MPPTDTLRRTPLFERHERAGARLVPFAGWEMPVQYEGIRQEHVAVRTGAGVFDVSHMGEIETSGPQAEELPPARALERRHEDRRAAARSTACSAARTAAYSTTCSPTGSATDRFLTVTNASNHEKDLAWFREHAGDFDVEVTDAHDAGRCWRCRARERAAPSSAIASGGELPARMRTADLEVAGRERASCAARATPARTAWRS